MDFKVIKLEVNTSVAQVSAQVLQVQQKYSFNKSYVMLYKLKW